jgi:D-arabinose 1-dehydrogenase-like Zn-dependent alcohol dehydrogenase
LFGGQVAGLEVAESKFELIEAMGGVPVLSRSFNEVDLTGVWPNKDPTVVIDLVGTPASLRWGLDTLAAGGRLILLTTFRQVEFPVAPRELVFREIDLLGSRYASRAELMEAAALVAAGQIRPMVSQVVPPNRINEVHQALRQGTLLGRGALDWRGEYTTTH